ncbi:hypothetical protein [Granulicella sp. WH15]|nr:hypothetical protein [Granulicella sp. WH15]
MSDLAIYHSLRHILVTEAFSSSTPFAFASTVPHSGNSPEDQVSLKR